MAHHFILLRLNPFGLRVYREGWWFEHSMSWLQVCLSAEGAKNISWPWLYPLRGWGSLTIAFTGKFVYIYIYIYIYIYDDMIYFVESCVLKKKYVSVTDINDIFKFLLAILSALLHICCLTRCQ